MAIAASIDPTGQLRLPQSGETSCVRRYLQCARPATGTDLIWVAADLASNSPELYRRRLAAHDLQRHREANPGLVHRRADRKRRRAGSRHGAMWPVLLPLWNRRRLLGAGGGPVSRWSRRGDTASDWLGIGHAHFHRRSRTDRLWHLQFCRRCRQGSASRRGNDAHSVHAVARPTPCWACLELWRRLPSSYSFRAFPWSFPLRRNSRRKKPRQLRRTRACVLVFTFLLRSVSPTASCVVHFLCCCRLYSSLRAPLSSPPASR